MKLNFLAPTSLFGLTAASLGAIAHAVFADGGASLAQFGTGGGLAAAAIALFVKLHSSWSAAGGKLDGHITDNEAKAVMATITSAVPLSPVLQQTAAQFAPQLGNQLIGRVEQTLPQATELIGLITRYQAGNEQDTADDHAAVLWKLLDVLSKDITGDTIGEDAAATLRARFDLKLFPGTPCSPSA